MAQKINETAVIMCNYFSVFCVISLDSLTGPQLL